MHSQGMSTGVRGLPPVKRAFSNDDSIVELETIPSGFVTVADSR